MEINTKIYYLHNGVRTEEIGPLGKKDIKLIPSTGNYTLQFIKELKIENFRLVNNPLT